MRVPHSVKVATDANVANVPRRAGRALAGLAASWSRGGMTRRSGHTAPTDWIEAHRTDSAAVGLDDVIGLNAAKRELVALSTRLTNSHRQLAIPRGILLWGPGCGKTLLARVLTNLLGGDGSSVPMYEFRATEFLKADTFERIGDAFADRADRVVQFVDEIDLFARGRDDERHTAETRRALYGALSLLDGLRRRDTILWLFATSRSPFTLDDALLRPGRIDAQIEVTYPDQATRERLLAAETGKLPVAEPLDLPRAAAMLGHRISPASVAAVCQAGLALALGDGLTGLDWPHLAEAIRRDGHVADVEDESDEMLWRRAVHEAGHALAAHLQGLPVTNVTILTRHGGRTDLEPLKPHVQAQTDDWIGRVATMALAGSVAETIVLGASSAGAQSDIDSATKLVLARFSMSKGPRPDTPRPARSPIAVPETPPSGDSCAGPIVLEFMPSPEAMAEAAVVLAHVGASVVLVSGGIRVGVLSDASVAALSPCLGRWQYAGTIISVEPDQGTASLVGTPLA